MDTGRLLDAVGSAGGFATRRQLRALGATDRDLARAVASGDLSRPRRGWYTALPPDDPRVVAVGVGGRLTGTSALLELGAWLWEAPDSVSVSVARNAARLRHRRGARVVWDGPRVLERGDVALVHVVDALRRAILEEPFEIAVALCDWALHVGRLSTRDFAGLVAELPADARSIADWVDADSESVLESVARVRLTSAGWRVTSQVRVGRGRIDLVVAGVVALELDGRRWHESAFEADRRKDVRILTGGRVPLRVTWSMVKDDWADVLGAVEAGVLLHRAGTEDAPSRVVLPREPSSGVVRLGGASRRSSRRVPTSRRGRAWRLPRRRPEQVSHTWSRSLAAATPVAPGRHAGDGRLASPRPGRAAYWSVTATVVPGDGARPASAPEAGASAPRREPAPHRREGPP